MEMLKMPKLDHSKNSFGEVMGLSDYEQHHAKTAILFETINCNLLAQRLFEDPEDAPADLRTVSGVLEKALSHSLSPAQQIYLCIEFHHTYMHTRNGIAAVQEMKESEQQKGKKEESEKQKGSISALLGKIMKKIHALPLEESIEAVKKCDHDFERFIALMIPKSMYNKDGSHIEQRGRGGRIMPGGDSIEDMIRKSLGEDSNIEFRFGSPDDDEDDD